MSTPNGKSDMKDQQLSCYRVWVRSKPAHKKSEKRNHGLLGHYLLGVKK
jgi:hypothetical protein